VATFSVDLLFQGIDLGDDSTLDALDALPVEWVSQGGYVKATAHVAIRNTPLEAVDWLISVVVTAVPSALPLRVDRNLVSISDIAARVGVTREAVRHWANGTRSGGGFPMPVGLVSNGTRLYEWGPVAAWLEHSLALWEQDALPLSNEDAARADLLVAQWRRRLAGCESGPHWSAVEYSRHEVPVTATSSSRRPPQSHFVTTPMFSSGELRVAG
jgi:hypothetical protein